MTSPPGDTPPIPHHAEPRRGASRLWLIPLACLLLAILLSLTAFWAMAARPSRDAGAGDTPAAAHGDTGPGRGDASTPGADGNADREEGATASATTDPATGSPTPASPAGTPDSTGLAPVTAAPVAPPQQPAPELGFTVTLAPGSSPAPTPQPRASAGGASGGAGASGGGPTFFGQPGRGTRFVYVIDKSGSMSGGRFNDATFELVRSIRNLRPHERFAVIFYDSQPVPMPFPGLLPATPQNQERVVDWLRTVPASGGTDPRQAMQIALDELQPDTIWLLSDGQFSIDTVDLIRAANPQTRTQINTVAFHDRDGEVILQRIARENDGDYRFVAPGSP